jgi:hypothetical protein
VRSSLGDCAPGTGAAIPAIPGNMAQVCTAKVRHLSSALANNGHPEALEAALALIDRVIVHPPAADGDPPSIELIGELMAMLSAGGVNGPEPGPQSAAPGGVLSMFVSSVKAAPGAGP